LPTTALAVSHTLTKTAKAVQALFHRWITPLKRGVNESARSGVLSLAALVALSAILGLAAGCKPQATAPVVLAKVGSREIRVEDFNNEVQWRLKNHRPLPDKEALLNEMITRELLVQKARAAGLENDPDFRRSYEGMLVSRIQERELTPRLDAVKPPPETVRALYEKNLAQYTRPAKARLAFIYIKIEPRMSADKLSEAEARIQEALKLAKALPPSSRGFDRVAVDYSEDQASRYKGGDVGWFDQGRTAYRWPAEVVSAGFALKTTGEISGVIRATNGFYIVSKLESRDSVITPLEQVQTSLERGLLTEKRREVEAAFRRETRAYAAVESFTQVLANVQYPAPTMAKAEEPQPPSLPTLH
jgi:peptidyl-prolyl cis-trans isomerase C